MTAVDEIRLTGVSKRFHPPHGAAVVALDGISLVLRNEVTILVGQNGSGKSTLINLLYGESHPDAGTIALVDNGRSVSLDALPLSERVQRIARVQQNPAAGTFGDLTVWENIRYAALSCTRASVFRRTSASDVERTFGPLLGELQLLARLRSFARDLSGGERQLVAVAMALIRKPSLLLLDEPTASLDHRNARSCMEKTRGLAVSSGIGILAVTHDFSQALEFADRILVLRGGRLVEDCGADDIERLTPTALAEACGMLEYSRGEHPRVTVGRDRL